ncbi:biofilm/acid-resistance regulator YmgB/AriR [Erwinia sp. E_sp_B04_7]|uniref:biofilm/acid-resistance regulator YmgB/AriR n=1 Tax=unclassified Erwinia TaxID=2622719 RepID=UPI0030CC15EB
MHTAIQSPHALTDYFEAEMLEAKSEVAILGSVIVEILHSGVPVTNKAIIAQLLKRLESTSDIVTLDLYRHVLEMVVHQTEDDLIS